MTRRPLAALLALTLGAAALALPTAALAKMDRAKRVQAMKGVVLLIALKKRGNKLVPVGRGSGSVIDSSGLILTNNHVIADTKTGRLHDVVAVGLTTAFDRTPRPSCLAFPSRAVRHTGLDLAIIKCEAEVNGKPLRRAISWPVVELGDASKVIPGDDLFIVGYPAIGGTTITFSAGKSSGFLSDPKLGQRAWIKTDALISPGVSGGAAFDEDGKLIGVPTQLRWRTGGRTNIGIVRPINRARPLIAAVQGKDWTRLPRAGAAARPRAAAALRIQLGPINLAGALNETSIRRAVTAALPRINACYLAALGRSPRLSGYMDLRLTVAAKGTGRVALARSTVADRALARCALGTLGALAFPRSGGVTTANVLLVFLGPAARTAPTPKPAPTPAPTPPVARVPRPAPVHKPSYRYKNASFVAGQVVDASTGRPVAGAVVLILKPGVQVSGLTRSTLNQQVATTAVSTSAGHFRSKQPLAQGQRYGVVLMARGYTTVAVDNAIRLLRGAALVHNLGRLRLRRRVH